MALVVLIAVAVVISFVVAAAAEMELELVVVVVLPVVLVTRALVCTGVLIVVPLDLVVDAFMTPIAVDMLNIQDFAGAMTAFEIIVPKRLEACCC